MVPRTESLRSTVFLNNNNCLSCGTCTAADQIPCQFQQFNCPLLPLHVALLLLLHFRLLADTSTSATAFPPATARDKVLRLASNLFGERERRISAH